MNLKNLLFITWDSDQTNYLESLFFPIFSGIQQKSKIRIFVAQFSWAKKEEVNRIKKIADQHDLAYFHFRVSRFPHPALGTIKAVLESSYQLTQLIFQKKIDILMPRSTIPAMMVNRIKSWIKAHAVQVIYDADGFPIQERVDFAGLNPNGFQHRYFEKQENLMLHLSDAVLTRSKRAISIHMKNNPDLERGKFFRVRNGRDENFFRIDNEKRGERRKELGYKNTDQVWVYTGSLGPAYAWDKLLELLRFFLFRGENVKLLVLTRTPDFIQDKLPVDLLERIKLVRTEFSNIPDYLNAGDLGISLRMPAPSLSGLFPIKLGEYLLTGLPVFASVQVGDTGEWIKERRGLMGIDLDEPDFAQKSYRQWKELSGLDREGLRKWAIEQFSLGKAVRDYLEVFEFLEK